MNKLILGSIGALALLVSSVGAKAQTIEYTGTTAVTFTGAPGGAYTISPDNSTLLDGANPLVMLSAGSFDVLTLGNTFPDNFVVVGANAAENLGVVTVGTSPQPGVNVSQPVQLVVTFTAPNVTGGTGNTYTTTINGQVNIQNSQGIDAVAVAFVPTGQDFTFDGPGGNKGSFTLHVAPIPQITSGHSGFITGDITVNVNVVPEPSSLALLLPGLTPLGFLLRRRRRSSRS